MAEQKIHIQCPIPIDEYPRVLLAHGGGGSLMHSLIEKMFLAAFDNKYLKQRTDAVTLEMTADDMYDVLEDHFSILLNEMRAVTRAILVQGPESATERSMS